MGGGDLDFDLGDDWVSSGLVVVLLCLRLLVCFLSLNGVVSISIAPRVPDPDPEPETVPASVIAPEPRAPTGRNKPQYSQIRKSAETMVVLARTQS